MTPTTVIEWRRPAMFDKQEAAVFHGARFGIVYGSPKSGKSVAGLIWIAERAIEVEGRSCWWVSPTFSQCFDMFTRLQRMLPRAVVESTNRTQMTVTLINGSVVQFKSADRPDTLYGANTDAVVVDEAARLSEMSWHAIRSTLSATGGPARLLSNVRARGWFHRLYVDAQNGKGDWVAAKLTWEDSVEAGYVDAADIEEARATLPSNIFTQLYEANLSDDDDIGIFNVAAIQRLNDAPQTWMTARGWDLAATAHKRSDHSVGLKLGVFDGGFVVLDVLRVKLEPDQLISTIAQTAIADGLETVQVIEEEKGSSGALLVEAIRREVINAGIRVESSKLTGDKVSRAIPAAGRAGSGRLAVLIRAWTDALLAELDEFPLGHDDQVDALSAAFGYLGEYEDIRTVLGSGWVPGRENEPNPAVVGGGDIGSGWSPANYLSPRERFGRE